jgi:PPM family protein phosphatase
MLETMKNTPLVEFGVASNIGRIRNENQDTFGVFPDVSVQSNDRLFVVADGMGGHKGGKNASELAVRSIGEVYRVSTELDTRKRLHAAFQTANESIIQESLDNPSLAGMGTTCVALAMKDNEVHIAHIGDSRAYCVAKGTLTQLTMDHSTVAELQRRRVLSAEEARIHPERSVLYRALGTRRPAEVDFLPAITPISNDRFVLCTDGLTNMVEDSQICEIVEHHSAQDACDELVRLANKRGGYDNITLIVIHVMSA